MTPPPASLLEVGGNLHDAVFLAVKAALHSARIPLVSVTSVDGGEPELELSDDPFNASRLDVTKVSSRVVGWIQALSRAEITGTYLSDPYGNAEFWIRGNMLQVGTVPYVPYLTIC